MQEADVKAAQLEHRASIEYLLTDPLARDLRDRLLRYLYLLSVSDPDSEAERAGFLVARASPMEFIRALEKRLSAASIELVYETALLSTITSMEPLESDRRRRATVLYRSMIAVLVLGAGLVLASVATSLLSASASAASIAASGPGMLAIGVLLFKLQKDVNDRLDRNARHCRDILLKLRTRARERGERQPGKADDPPPRGDYAS
jgi:hypothetical protein